MHCAITELGEVHFAFGLWPDAFTELGFLVPLVLFGAICFVF